MRKLIILAALFAIALPAFAGDHPEHPKAAKTGWFDFENCVFCKNLMEDPNLLSHTTWENHKVANGMMNIMTVAPEFKSSMAKANKAMEGVGMDIQSGKSNPMTMKMCGHCQEWGQLMMAGVTLEKVEGDAADVTLTTSDDPVLVARLHKLVERNNMEMEKMMAVSHDHSGHQH